MTLRGATERWQHQKQEYEPEPVGVVGSIVNRNRFRETEISAFHPEVVIPKPSKEIPGVALYPTEINDRVAANANSLHLDVPEVSASGASY